MNWWAVILISIWLSAALGSFATKDWLPFVAAIIGTIVIGIGYCLIHNL